MLTPEQARAEALEVIAWYERPFTFLNKVGLDSMGRTLNRRHAKQTYRTGEPFLTYELKPSEALLYSNEVEALCLESKHLMGVGEAKDNATGLERCRNTLRGKDYYEVPILNRRNEYVFSVSVAAYSEPGSGSGGVGEADRVSAVEAQKLAGTRSEPKLYSFNVPTDFEPYSDDYLEGHVRYWLTDGLAVDPNSGEVFEVQTLEGESVDLLQGEVEPYVEQRNWLGQYGEDVMPLLLFPVKLEPLSR